MILTFAACTFPSEDSGERRWGQSRQPGGGEECTKEKKTTKRTMYTKR